MNYNIVIPSYKRAEKLKSHTLELLKDFEPDCINIFVANENELENYKNICGEQYNYIVGEGGKANIENIITNYFDDGELLIHLDDDIIDIFEVIKLNEKKFKRLKVDNLNTFFENAFIQMYKCNATMWGVALPTNDLWISNNKIIKPSRLVSGQLFGIIHDKNNIITTLLDDVERSCYCFYNKNDNLILGRYSIKVGKNWAKGGLETERTKESFIDAYNFIKDKYPDCCKEIKILDKPTCPIKIVWKSKRLNQYSNELILNYFRR